MSLKGQVRTEFPYNGTNKQSKSKTLFKAHRPLHIAQRETKRTWISILTMDLSVNDSRSMKERQWEPDLTVVRNPVEWVLLWISQQHQSKKWFVDPLQCWTMPTKYQRTNCKMWEGVRRLVLGRNQTNGCFEYHREKIILPSHILLSIKIQ